MFDLLTCIGFCFDFVLSYWASPLFPREPFTWLFFWFTRVGFYVVRRNPHCFAFDLLAFQLLDPLLQNLGSNRFAFSTVKEVCCAAALGASLSAARASRAAARSARHGEWLACLDFSPSQSAHFTLFSLVALPLF